MRFDTPIYFQRVVPGKYDEQSHNYGEDEITETEILANVADTGAETLKLVYGKIKQGSLTIKLQMPYKKAFDRIRVGDKFYTVDLSKTPRNQQILVVSELQGAYTGLIATGGYAEGYEDGKKAEKAEFWQNFMNRNLNYSLYGFSTDAFYPVGTLEFKGSCQRAFYNFSTNSYGTAISFDLATRLKECGATLDFSKATDVAYLFGSSGVFSLPEMNFTSATKLDAPLNNCTFLTTVEKIVLKDNGSNTFSSNTFNCKALVEVRFEGIIGTNITFQYCPLLSVESMKSIILHLANYFGTDKEFLYTVKFPDNCWQALEADSPAPDGSKWADYVFNLGWNT